MTAIVRLFTVAIAAGATLLAPLPGFADGDSVVDRVRATGEIALGVRRDARPHSYLDQTGTPAGYTVEV